MIPFHLQSTNRFFLLPALLFVCGFAGAIARPQEPPPPPPADAPSSQAPQDAHRRKIPPFLIVGTVFNENGLAFPGVQVRIRPKGQKKFSYETYTNSRGEFAVRVPDGIEYEVVVHQKKYADQNASVLANLEDVQKRLTFRLERPGTGKAGDSK